MSTRNETTLLALIALSIAGIAVGLFWWSLSIPWIGLKVAAASSVCLAVGVAFYILDQAGKGR